MPVEEAYGCLCRKKACLRWFAVACARTERTEEMMCWLESDSVYSNDKALKNVSVIQKSVWDPATIVLIVGRYLVGQLQVG